MNEVYITAISVASDLKFGRRYADLIVEGKKFFETRSTNSLSSYINKTVSVVRTGEGTTEKAIGSIHIGKPIIVNEKQFRRLEKHHCVPKGSTFDIKKGGTKYLYPLAHAKKYSKEYDVSHGIISRKVKTPYKSESKRMCFYE